MHLFIVTDPFSSSRYFIKLTATENVFEINGESEVFDVPYNTDRSTLFSEHLNLQKTTAYICHLFPPSPHIFYPVKEKSWSF